MENYRKTHPINCHPHLRTVGKASSSVGTGDEVKPTPKSKATKARAKPKAKSKAASKKAARSKNVEGDGSK